MKKSVFRRIFMTGMGIVFFTFSCTNLDEKLYSDVTANNFFKTDEEFIAALGQAYSSFGGIGNHFSLWTINELSSDELVISTKGGDWYDGGVLLQMHELHGSGRTPPETLTQELGLARVALTRKLSKRRSAASLISMRPMSRRCTGAQSACASA